MIIDFGLSADEKLFSIKSLFHCMDFHLSVFRVMFVLFLVLVSPQLSAEPGNWQNAYPVEFSSESGIFSGFSKKRINSLAPVSDYDKMTAVSYSLDNNTFFAELFLFVQMLTSDKVKITIDEWIPLVKTDGTDMVDYKNQVAINEASYGYDKGASFPLTLYEDDGDTSVPRVFSCRFYFTVDIDSVAGKSGIYRQDFVVNIGTME